MPAPRLLRFGSARRKRNTDEPFRRQLETVERKAHDRYRLSRSLRIRRFGIESRDPVFREQIFHRRSLRLVFTKQKHRIFTSQIRGDILRKQRKIAGNRRRRPHGKRIHAGKLARILRDEIVEQQRRPALEKSEQNRSFGRKFTVFRKKKSGLQKLARRFQHMGFIRTKSVENRGTFDRKGQGVRSEIVEKRDFLRIDIGNIFVGK